MPACEQATCSNKKKKRKSVTVSLLYGVYGSLIVRVKLRNVQYPANKL